MTTAGGASCAGVPRAHLDRHAAIALFPPTLPPKLTPPIPAPSPHPPCTPPLSPHSDFGESVKRIAKKIQGGLPVIGLLSRLASPQGGFDELVSAAKMGGVVHPPPRTGGAGREARLSAAADGSKTGASPGMRSGRTQPLNPTACTPPHSPARHTRSSAAQSTTGPARHILRPCRLLRRRTARWARGVGWWGRLCARGAVCARGSHRLGA
jgi:hypothetical protein